MRQYQLSESRVRRILHAPHRTEKGIVEGTNACMQRSRCKNPYELWVMYIEGKEERKIISTWRYPGITEPREELPSNVRTSLEEIIEKALLEEE